MTEAPEGSLRIFGHDAISAFVPFLLFVFTNALGIDYTIHLMSRLEEADETCLVDGTRLSLLDLIQLGFAVALGVLIDTARSSCRRSCCSSAAGTGGRRAQPPEAARPPEPGPQPSCHSRSLRPK